MQSAQRFEVDAANPSKDSLVDRLLQRMTGSAKYSQLDVSDQDSVRRSQDRWSPEEDATWWARLTYSYASGLIKLGYSQPLQQEHLWDMARQHEAIPVSSKFHAALAATQDPMKAPHVRFPVREPHRVSCCIHPVVHAMMPVCHACLYAPCLEAPAYSSHQLHVVQGLERLRTSSSTAPSANRADHF